VEAASCAAVQLWQRHCSAPTAGPQALAATHNCTNCRRCWCNKEKAYVMQVGCSGRAAPSVRWPSPLVKRLFLRHPFRTAAAAAADAGGGASSTSATSASRAPTYTCRRCKQEFTAAANSPRACHFHPCIYTGGEMAKVGCLTIHFKGCNKPIRLQDASLGFRWLCFTNQIMEHSLVPA
jgi:hypothetical protein